MTRDELEKIEATAKAYAKYLSRHPLALFLAACAGLLVLAELHRLIF